MSQNEQRSNTPFWQPALIIFTQVTGWIAAPIIAALFLGRYLDDKYGTEPWIFLGLTVMAFLISFFGIVSITIKYVKKIEKELKEKPTKGGSLPAGGHGASGGKEQNKTNGA